MILLIKTNKESLHELEFVKPIENILKQNKIGFFTMHYSKLSMKIINSSEKIIICGTSLQDNEFAEDISKFKWIKDCEKPILGICAGMQIISLVFGGKLDKKPEVGFYKENFTKEFLGLKGEHEVYHLHNNYITFPKEFESFTESKILQAIKHKTKNIFGVLFHPEVRNKELILNFINLKNNSII